jgi:DDE superfamily endonuclease
MEEVLEVYRLPYDPRFPVVCMDETSKQLVSEVAAPVPPAQGRALRQDYEYRRNGVANLFLAFEPLRGWRWVEVTERRTRKDWAGFVALLLERHYPQAECLLLVLDNLNTHSGASFYEAFAPEKARELLGRLHFVHTPKHGSWLNLAEAEFSILQRQCLDRRIPEIPILERETHAWVHQRNQLQLGADWQFTTQDARIKLKKLYPSF